MRRILVSAALMLLMAGCADSGGDVRTTTTQQTDSDFIVASPDFADGGELADWATASAFNGQCTGDNLNPALDWSGAPAGTQAYAIVMIDRSAGDFVHWVHLDIPGNIAGVEKGGSAILAGADGANDGPTPGYFGPCPPGPDHRYEFAVYALDALLGLEDGARFADVRNAIEEHELAKASIIGMRSGPA